MHTLKYVGIMNAKQQKSHFAQFSTNPFFHGWSQTITAWQQAALAFCLNVPLHDLIHVKLSYPLELSCDHEGGVSGTSDCSQK